MASTSDDFWDRVNKDGPVHPTLGACWLWKTGSPYGWYLGEPAHRASWQMHNGPIPDGMKIDHRCFNQRCVRPEHLRLASQKQNAEHKSGARKDSYSRVRGVSWSRREQKWVVRVTHNHKTREYGRFDDLDEAAARARQVRNELFTHNDADKTPG